MDIRVTNSCKILKHIGQAGWAVEEGRIPLYSVEITDGKDSTYKLKSDTLIFKIPSKESISFFFSIKNRRIIGKFNVPVDLERCQLDLELRYIDPSTGELSSFSYPFPPSAK